MFPETYRRVHKHEVMDDEVEVPEPAGHLCKSIEVNVAFRAICTDKYEYFTGSVAPILLRITMNTEKGNQQMAKEMAMDRSIRATLDFSLALAA